MLKIDQLQKLLLKLLILFALFAILFFQGYFAVIFLGGLIVGLGFITAMVWGLLGLSGLSLFILPLWKFKILIGVTLAIAAIILWHIGITNSLIDSWTGTIYPETYSLLLSGFVFGITIPFNVWFFIKTLLGLSRLINTHRSDA